MLNLKKEISDLHQRWSKLWLTCDNNNQGKRFKIESSCRYTIRNIVKTVVKSLSRVHFILKPILKVQKISARWIPQILTDDKK